MKRPPIELLLLFALSGLCVLPSVAMPIAAVAMGGLKPLTDFLGQTWVMLTMAVWFLAVFPLAIWWLVYLIRILSRT